MGDNKQLKEKIQDLVLDQDELDNIVILEGDEFADGAIGLTDDNCVVYSYDRLVESLAKSYDEEDPERAEEMAREWIDYNTIRSLPYMAARGLKAPLIIHEFC